METVLADPPGSAAPGHALTSMPAARGRRDLPALLAVGLLMATLLWRAVLIVWAPAPARARDLLASPANTSDTGRLVLLVDAPGTRASNDAADRARRAWPGFPLDIRAAGVPSSASRAEGAGLERLRSLARSYGYPGLPLLLTLDQDGHVVRIIPM